jgi:predicted permease
MSEQLQSGQKIERPGILVEDGSAGPVNGARREMRQILFLLMGVVALVLLIACANLASLLLARGAVRGHELALRVAIGAGRFPLVRQLLTESSLLALAGGVLGLVLTPIGTSLLGHMLAGIEEAPAFDLRIDYRVLLFTLALSLLTALLCGLLPALRATRSVPASGLRGKQAHGVQRLKLIRVLVAVQVALSLLLLVGAGLFLKTLAVLSLVDPGFRTQDVLTLRLDASKAGYRGRALVDFYERARQSFAAIPGVREVSTSNLVLLGHGVVSTGFTVPGRGDSGHLQANLLRVGESFFSTMGIPLLMGRDLSAADGEAGTKVAVVNETLARTLLSSPNPIGTTLRIGDTGVQVVGVCRDAKYEDLGRTSPTIYLPYRQYPGETGAMFFEVRTVVPPHSVAATVRRNVAALDRNVPLTSMRTQAALVDDSLLPFRLVAGLSACFGSLALLLSAIGLYGVMSFAVAQRTNEIGVRIALGARRGDVLRMVLRDALVVVGSGLALGIPAAAGATFIAQRTLYGIRLLDPIVPAVATGVLLAVGAIAAAFPAVRATRVDPVISLRHE